MAISLLDLSSRRRGREFGGRIRREPVPPVVPMSRCRTSRLRCAVRKLAAASKPEIGEQRRLVSDKEVSWGHRLYRRSSSAAGCEEELGERG